MNPFECQLFKGCTTHNEDQRLRRDRSITKRAKLLTKLLRARLLTRLLRNTDGDKSDLLLRRGFRVGDRLLRLRDRPPEMGGCFPPRTCLALRLGDLALVPPSTGTPLTE